jgi:hypothetical protein
LLATLQAKAAPKLSAAFTEDPDQPTKIKITWEVADRADTYVNLRYSPDNGTSWQILALQLDGSSYILDTTKIPGSDSGLVEIVANSTTDASAMRLAIGQVKDKVPLVAILQSNQTEFAPGEAIVLFGAAVDFEDGSLTDQSLTWFNASNEILGTGNQLIIPQGLPTGKHTIFLRAIDSAQRIAITNIDIVVGDQQEIFLPIISR